MYNKCIIKCIILRYLSRYLSRYLYDIYIIRDICRYNVYFFFKSFWQTHALFWGHWYPCFGFLVTSSLGFKARVGSALFAIFAEADVMYLWCYTCQPLGSRQAAGHFPTCPPEVGLGSDSNVQSHEQKTNALPLCQRPGWYNVYFVLPYRRVCLQRRSTPCRTCPRES